MRQGGKDQGDQRRVGSQPSCARLLHATPLFPLQPQQCRVEYAKFTSVSTYGKRTPCMARATDARKAQCTADVTDAALATSAESEQVSTFFKARAAVGDGVVGFVIEHGAKVRPGRFVDDSAGVQAFHRSVKPSRGRDFRTMYVSRYVRRFNSNEAQEREMEPGKLVDHTCEALDAEARVTAHGSWAACGIALRGGRKNPAEAVEGNSAGPIFVARRDSASCACLGRHVCSPPAFIVHTRPCACGFYTLVAMSSRCQPCVSSRTGAMCRRAHFLSCPPAPFTRRASRRVLLIAPASCSRLV